MRKIESRIRAAFEAGHRLCVNNTLTDGISVWLHGNEIIRKVPGGIEIRAKIGFRLWNTTTTRSRLRNLVDADVCSRKFELHLNGKPWNGEWADPLVFGLPEAVQKGKLW